MKFIKRFESFINEAEVLEPKTKPSTRPSEPSTAPERRDRPSRPNPIRRERVSPVPAPAKASAEDVVKKFINLMNETDEDIKKYVN